MRIPITSPVGKWWVVAVPEGDLYVTDDDGIFWSEEDFNDSLNKLFGTVAFPELNKGECMEIELVCELKMK